MKKTAKSGRVQDQGDAADPETARGLSSSIPHHLTDPTRQAASVK